MSGMNDLRYAARMLAKSPGFTLVAIGLLAAGIGANTVMFSAIDAILLRTLPVRHPEELVRLVQKTPQLGTRSSFSYLYYEALRDHASNLSIVFGEQEELAAMNEPAPAEEIRLNMVTPEFFEALGVPAMLGRTLTRDDAKENPGAPPAVLSYAFWKRRFNGDPAAVGREITLKKNKFVIVGVMPRDFNGISVDTTPDVRVPVRLAPVLLSCVQCDRRPQLEQMPNLALAARLRPGVTPAQAQAEAFELWRATTQDFAKRFDQDAALELRRGMELEPLARGVSILRDKFSAALKLLAASVGLLLLMVCANVAGLLLARGASRREEIAVRLALGAGRGRIVRQVLTESAMLAAAGACGGMFLAWILTPLLSAAFPPVRDLTTERLNLALRFAVDARVLVFSILVSCVCVVLAGLAPALSAASMRNRPSRAYGQRSGEPRQSFRGLETILRGARASSGWRGRQALIVFQIGLCTLLLAGAGLLARTFAGLRAIDPGFDRDHIVTFTANPSLASYTPAQAEALRVALVAKVREISGVRDVAIASRALMRGSGVKMTVEPMGQRASTQDFLDTSINWVSPEYFSTLGMHTIAGRDFTAADAQRPGSPLPVIVNQAFATRFFPNQEPVGKLFGSAGSSPAKGSFEIVGVASDAKYRSLREPMTPTFYQSWKPDGDAFQLIVRASGRPEAMIQPVRRALASIDPALPFTEINTMSEEIDASTAAERTTATLASIFAMVAAGLAGVGIYGLLAYTVAQRRREIGIRVAIGARPAHIGRMIGAQSVAMAVAGVVLGLAAAAFAGPWIRSLLYGVAPADPVSLAGAAIFVLLTALVAAAIPASQAVRIDPASALREN